ncbi:ATP-binding protein [Geomicrobium sp. JCM 19055]|uniref:ATP-binding protein n=1 Tax=Geomicrobium sp. JCM 19055 TaxID=1460649 RepID=UPI00045ED9AB|nr:ATP-binding protein [Geomicrobium sp. JCM 19055]GAK00894.1 helicase loader DnaI [Geomicrobium sp. JCM 19055]
METMEHRCQLADVCKVAGEEGKCNVLCSPFMMLHGVNGDGGIWKARNVPKKYEGVRFDNLPIQEDNPTAYEWVARYVNNITANVEKGIGLFFYSVSTQENRLGTGTGKTTSAITILNEYVKARTIEHTKGIRKMENNPALFYKASDYQALYNSQFNGTDKMKEEATLKYYRIKEQFKTVDLLVLDDVGIRDRITDNFENELTEVIDARDGEELATIFTSNLDVSSLEKTLGHRITSRIDGMTEQIALYGTDKRKGGILK